jgi:hypothetical protein
MAYNEKKRLRANANRVVPATSSLLFFCRLLEALMARRQYYGFTNFVGDAFMTVITCGLWLIWVFIREIRNL